MPLRTRLAPTPSGLLHPGNGLSFVLTWALTRAAGGEVLLRIDDLDKARRRREYLEDVFETLEWLGLDYDIGPGGPDDFLKNYSQHTRLDLYREALERLRESGCLYACTCSRRQIREASPSGIYPLTCRELRLPFEAERTAWRVSVPAGKAVTFREWQRGEREINLAETMGDFVVRQKNKMPAYQIASLVDDLHYDINFIVRGEDLLDSTAAQIYLAELLGEDAFLQTLFWHHGLLTDESGGKLSKTKGAGSLRAWREAGKSPLSLYRRAGSWLGLAAEEIGSLENLVDRVKLFLESHPVD